MSKYFSIIILAVACCVGCQSEKPKDEVEGSGSKSPVSQPSSSSGMHSHGEGPNGGAIADWGGGKFHVEFTVSHDKKEATVYILGSDEKTPVPIDAKEIQLDIDDPKLSAKLIAKPLEGETDGECSRFVGTDDGLAVVQEYKGTISGTVDGTPYSGNFEEVAE